jgi:hypothetical protein
VWIIATRIRIKGKRLIHRGNYQKILDNNSFNLSLTNNKNKFKANTQLIKIILKSVTVTPVYYMIGIGVQTIQFQHLLQLMLRKGFDIVLKTDTLMIEWRKSWPHISKRSRRDSLNHRWRTSNFLGHSLNPVSLLNSLQRIRWTMKGIVNMSKR